MTLSIQRILCGVDFSPASIAAFDLSVMLAREYGAPLGVVHAYVTPSAPLAESGIVVVDEKRLVASVEHDLQELVSERGDPSITVECTAAAGWPAHAVIFEARRIHADLIVLGTRGLTGLPRFLLGSVAERVARTSPVPVLVVPEPSDEERPRPVRTVLCGVDFSDPAAEALRAAAATAEKHGAALHVVHAWEPPGFLGSHPSLAATHERDLERELDAYTRRILPSALQLSRRVRRGAASGIIVDEARTTGADLIVVGSTGRSGFAHLLLGSVAERVLRLSPVPVLIVREPPEATQSSD